MGGTSIWHWLVVGVIVLLLFGRGKISEMMGDVAKGIKAFKKGMSEEEAAAAATPVQPGTTTTTTNDPVRTIEHQPGPTQPAPVVPTPTASTVGDRKIG
jgi:sec-independent protein translocase protein TatA